MDLHRCGAPALILPCQPRTLSFADTLQHTSIEKIISFPPMTRRIAAACAGSLIAYFKYRQGASFYVKLYCAFYLPGLPVSLLQQKYDEKMDLFFGSANSFMWAALPSPSARPRAATRRT